MQWMRRDYLQGNMTHFLDLGLIKTITIVRLQLRKVAALLVDEIRFCEFTE